MFSGEWENWIFFGGMVCADEVCVLKREGLVKNDKFSYHNVLT